MRRIIILVFFALIFLNAGKLYAASSKYEVSTKYLLAEDGSATVESTIYAKNVSDEATPKEMILPLVGKNTREVLVKYEDGAAITNGFSDGKNEVKLTLNRDFAGNDKAWKLTLSYKADLVKTYGTTKIFDVLPQKYGDLEITRETVIMQAAVGLGQGVARGPRPELTSVSLGEQNMTWTNKKGTLEESVGVLFGKNSVADLNLIKTLKNNSWWWQTMELVLPPDTNQQSVVLDSIEPTPTDLHLDLDGNIIAQYKIRPKGSVEVKASGQVHLFNYEYALGGSSGLENIPQALKEDYTGTNETWNGDQVQVDTKEKQAVSQMLSDIFQASVDLIPDESTGLDEATKWSNVLVGELRSAGIPARLILGQSYADGISQFDTPQPFAWVEAYVPATGWVTLDPMVQRGSNLYGFSDTERIALVMRGVNPGYPPDNLTDFSFSWQDKESTDVQPASGEVSATNYVIFPGFAIRAVQVKMGSGRIVDDAAVNVEGEGITKLGSLAPLQNSKTNMLVLGSAAFAGTKVSYGVLTGEDLSTAVAETTSSVSYLPMIILVVAIILFVVAIIAIKRFFRRRSDSKPNKTSIVMNSDDSGMSIDEFNIDDIDNIPEPDDEPELEPEIEPEPAQTKEPDVPEPQEPARPDLATSVKSDTIRQQSQSVRTQKRPPRLIQ